MSQNDPGEPVGPTTVIERPPPGPGRGHYPVPAWVVATLGATVVLGALAWFAWRLIRRAK
ncbi:MAG TPA: hypothetical protein VHE30_26500 [Polyangiaceae bacterium]|nr:hypothetical protein [Polyangiaceae bacterium]